MIACLASRSIAFVSRNIAAFSAGSALTALILGGAAHAVTDTLFKYSTPKTGYFSIHPMALSPANHTATYSIGFTDGVLNGTGCFSTGVNLPNGATITALTVWFLSNASDDPIFYFVRHELATGSEVAFVTSAVVHDDSANRKAHTFTIPNTTNARVSNGKYDYGFAYCGTTSQDEFLGARVTYTYTTAGD
jgi:hypothetical protein